MSRRLIWFIAGGLLCSLSHSMAQVFPDGPGKDIVISNCGRCHDLDRLRSGHSAEGWQIIIHKMQALGMGLPEGRLRTVIEYLAKNFPEQGGPPPAKITQSNGPINLPLVCDQRGVCCMGEREGCFGRDTLHP
jgi:hypothetical protein